jgi:hypothetical protein
MLFEAVVIIVILPGYSYVYWQLPVYGIFNGCFRIILELRRYDREVVEEGSCGILEIR